MASPTLLAPHESSQKQSPRAELLPRLDEARRQVVRTRGWIALCWSAAAAVVLLSLMAALDYWFVAPYLLRAVWLAATMVAFVVSVVFVWQRWIRPFSSHQAAAEIERHRPEYGQRLRTVADYEDPNINAAPAHQNLLGALRQQTEQTSTNADFEQLAAKEPLTKSVALLAGIVVLALFMLLSGREIRLAAGRTLLLPWYYTTVTVTPLSAVVKAGDSVKVEAVVDGRPIESAIMQYRQVGAKQWKTIPLRKVTRRNSAGSAPTQRASIKTENVNDVPHSGKFTLTLADCRHDLEFQVDAGPRELPLGHVEVLQPLTLKSTLARITPPEYLQRPIEDSDSLDLKVYEGSRVDLQLNWNRPPAKVMLQPSGSTKEKTSVESADKTSLSMQILQSKSQLQLDDLRQSITFNIKAATADGIELEPTRIKIRVIPDNKPRVELVRPPEQFEVTPTTEVAMNLSASDDLGLQKVGIVYQIGSGELQTLYADDLHGSTDPLQLARTLMLEQYDLTHHDQISYYAFAEDNYFGKPRRSVTPMRFIDIRPYKRDFQMVDGGSGSCNGCSLTLEELIARQRNNLGLTFTASEQSSVSDQLQQRLITNEREILDATSEFADGLALRGNPVQALDDAIGGMEAAVAKLNNQKLSDAVADEQRAVTALVRARKNLRQLLSNSSSSSSSSCRTFDRQQRQKLRTPEEKKQSEQQQAAERRQQLNDLAKRQRKWSEDVRQGQKSAQLDNQQQPQQQKQQSSSSSSTSSSSQAKSSSQKNSSELSKQQQNMIDEFKKLAQQLSQLSSSTNSMQQRAEEIANQMQQSRESLDQQQSRAAAQQSSDAADQMEQLADHLAAMNSQDFMDRLGQAQRTAQHLARREEALQQQLKEGAAKSHEQGAGDSQSSDEKSTSQGSPASETLADQQRGYATQTDMLGELLARLQAEAFEQGPGTQQSLNELRSANPPEDIANQMRSAADALQSNQPENASANIADAAHELDAIANQLRELRSEFAQPQLDELIALEQKIAELVKQLAEAKSSAFQDALAEQIRDVQAKLEALASEDSRIAQALQHATSNPSSTQNSQNSNQNQSQQAGNHTPNSQPGNHEVAEGFYTRDHLLARAGLMELNGILQTKIQEMILAGSQMDVDESVPPEYKDLVEQYYRELSDDLRE